MKYGEHTSLVEEVIDLAKDGNLLHGKQIEPSWHVVRDFDEAKRFAWEAVIGPDELTWTDLRELEMAEVRGKTHRMHDFTDVKHALRALLKLFTSHVRRQLDDDHSEVLDDFIGDLYCCAFNRAVNGSQDFFESLFKAYKAGGWPCGWTGEYPAGQLVVYCRG